MKLSIVSPEETLYEGEVKSVKMQGIDGKFQVLNNHAPLISALGKGDIVIEERPAREVTDFEIKVYNPAFDVTPAELISGIVTEKGVFRPPFDFGKEK